MTANTTKHTLIILLAAVIALSCNAETKWGGGISPPSPSVVYFYSRALASELAELHASKPSIEFYGPFQQAYIIADGLHIGFTQWEGGNLSNIPGPDYAVLRASSTGLELGWRIPNSRSTLGVTFSSTQTEILITHLNDGYDGDPDDTLDCVFEQDLPAIEAFIATELRLLSFLGLNVRFAYRLPPQVFFPSLEHSHGLVFSASLIVGKLPGRQEAARDPFSPQF